MRLRRSDFKLWDYPKRKIWSRFINVLNNRELKDEEFLAWMIKRANSRALYKISKRCGTLKWLIAIGIAIDKPKGSNSIAIAERRLLINRIKNSIEPENRRFLGRIANLYCK